jgi:acarbose 7IV-phosphotransferase
MQPGTFDVVVVGAIGIDTNVYAQAGYIDATVETHFTENLDYVGQSGGFSSRGFARLGKKTAVIGYVGDDYSGAYIRQELAKDGIDTTALFVDPLGTSRSVNLMSADGRRTSFLDGKGHMHLRPDLEMCRAVLAHAHLAHFNIPNWARLLLPVARELGLTISCDLHDIVSLPDAHRQDFIDAADIVFFSAAHHADPAALTRAMGRGPRDKIVIVGMGSRGCAVVTGQTVRRFAAVPGDSPIVDTNGAGDGLAVGFLSSFVLDGCALEHAIWRGQIVARYTCTP